MERDIEIGWIAGFLDGEGCFGWYGVKRLPNSRKKGLGYPSVVACQNDPEPLHRILDRFPAGVMRLQPKINGKEHWEYRAINEVAIDIMAAVFPLMSTR